MNNLNPPTSGTWHSMYHISDRQKVVHILTNALKEIQGNNYNEQKASSMATEFEKYTFFKSQSRDEYLRVIKQKINQLRSNVRLNGMNGMGMNGMNGMGMNNVNGNMNMNSMGMNNMNGSMNNNMSSNMNSNMSGNMNNNMNSNMNSNMNNNMNTNINSNMNNNNMNMMNNSMNNMGMNNNMNNNNMNNMNNMNNNYMRNQLNPQPNQPKPVARNQNLSPQQQQQIQQISTMIRSAPIPQALLAKLPNLPPNVNTWNQIFELYSKKMLPASSMPLVKEIHNTHLQLALRQHQQRKLSQQGQQPQPPNQPIPQQQPTQPPQNQPQNQRGSFNMNNLTPQQRQQLLQRQQQQQPKPVQQPQPQTQQPPISGGANVRPPNFQITPQDILKYNSEAMALLNRLQASGSIQSNLDNNQKDAFIRKFILHQKTTQWKQENGIGTNNTTNTNTNNVRRPQQLPMLNNNQLNNNQIPSPMMKQGQVNLTSPVMNQRQPVQQTQPQRPTTQPNNAPVRPGSGGPNNLPTLTEDMKVRLRQLIEEVSRNHVNLKDVTNVLSPQDKNLVKETMQKVSQQYSTVDSIISYFFILTKNIEGTKRLIQMKYMTKNIMESLQRGIFLATPDLTEKLRVQYAKYFDYVREQFNNKRQVNGNPPAQPMVQQPSVQTQNNMRFNNGANTSNVNLGQPNQWPNMSQPNQQQRMSSPIMANSPAINQTPNNQAVNNRAKIPAKRPSNSAQGGRRKSTKNATTPSAGGNTPASMGNTVKTPNSITTPQVNGGQSNKNTPSDQSPNYSNKIVSGKLNENTIGDIFGNDSSEDAELKKRRELSTNDPEKFFFASLSNLLELDEDKGLPTPASTNSKNSWTCQIKPEAIVTAFKQVSIIKEATSLDILKVCETQETPKVEKEDIDLDLLFDDKKIQPDDWLFKEVDLDTWKDNWSDIFISKSLDVV